MLSGFVKSATPWVLHDFVDENTQTEYKLKNHKLEYTVLTGTCVIYIRINYTKRILCF